MFNFTMNATWPQYYYQPRSNLIAVQLTFTNLSLSIPEPSLKLQPSLLAQASTCMPAAMKIVVASSGISGHLPRRVSPCDAISSRYRFHRADPRGLEYGTATIDGLVGCSGVVIVFADGSDSCHCGTICRCRIVIVKWLCGIQLPRCSREPDCRAILKLEVFTFCCQYQ